MVWLGDPGEAPEGAVRVHAKADLGTPPARVDLAVSALTGEGLEDLSRMLIYRSRALLPAEGEVALNARHRAALGEAQAAIAEATAATDLLVAAELLRAARAALDRVTGRAGVEDMLDALFSRFCVGK